MYDTEYAVHRVDIITEIDMLCLYVHFFICFPFKCI